MVEDKIKCFIEEYRLLSQGISDIQKSQRRIIEFSILTGGIFLTAILKIEQDKLFDTFGIIFLSLVFLMFSLLYVNKLYRILRISTYMKDHLIPKINTLLNNKENEAFAWESYQIEKYQSNSLHGFIYNFYFAIELGLILLCSLISLAVGFTMLFQFDNQLLNEYPWTIGIYISIYLTLIGILVFKLVFIKLNAKK